VEETVSRLGYIGVLIGTFMEGETTILLAAIFAKFGYMKLRQVMFWSFVGTFAGDCSFFFLGKCFGRSVIERYEFLRNKAATSRSIIHQHRHLILFIMRFLAGFRSIILLLLGCANLRTSRFLFIDVASSAIWAFLVSLLGYSFANVVYIFVSDIKGYERVIIPGAVGAAVATILLYRHLIREKEEEQFDGNRCEAPPGADKEVRGGVTEDGSGGHRELEKGSRSHIQKKA
jgi:membrane protein DedA with SNARE-associated domain